MPCHQGPACGQYTLMTIHELLKEYNLETDDVRWSLCRRIAAQLTDLLNEEGPDALTRKLWSGEVGDELYNMEERWIQTQDDHLSRKKRDESHIRDELSVFSADKIKRFSSP